METHKREFSADGKMLDLWRRLVEAEFVKRRKALPRRINKVLEKFVAIGAATGGGAYSRVRAAYDSEIDKRADIVLRILEKVHRKVGSPPITEALEKKVTDQTGGYVEAIVNEIAGCMDERRPGFMLPESLFDFEDKEREVKERIDAELGLYFGSVGVGKKPETRAKGKKKKAESTTKNRPTAETKQNGSAIKKRSRGGTLSIDKKGLEVRYNGIAYSVTERQADFLEELNKKPGEWIPGSKLKKPYTERLDKIKKKLPEPIKALIESHTCNGYRLMKKDC